MPRDGTRVPFFGTGTEGFSCAVSSQRRVNVYVEYPRDKEQGPLAIFGRPGLTLFGTAGGGTAPPLVRGMVEPFKYQSVFDGIREIGLIVCGSQLNTVLASGVISGTGAALGTIDGPVGFAKNPTQVLVADGQYGYSFDPTTLGLTQITSGWFPAGATSVTFMNGRGFAVRPNTGQLFYSALNDFLTGGASNYYTAESDPDDLRAVLFHFGQLALFGQFTTEFWASGSGTTIIQRVGGAALQWGLAALRSIAQVDQGTIFLGQNRQGDNKVLLMQGYGVKPVSTPEIEDRLQSLPVAAAVASTYAVNGHTFYHLAFPDHTMVYDFTSDTWNEETSGAAMGRGLGQLGCLMFGKYLVSDHRANGRIYHVDPTSYTDAGDIIKRLSVTKHSFVDYDRVSVDKLGLEFEAGVGLISGQGSDPQIMHRCSRDLGHTWGNEVWEPMGVMGDYGRYPVWTGPWGRGRDFLFEISMTDPVKFALTSGSLKVRK